ncbi:hypothetical protein BDW02DRAFT_505000 [Decorospora gaudefroyi]|uniref:P-loop containing nucleoside triphosphate hydrolase protein n=1 Tax=Decorospora gaudefroyi TaxID=184978 RepID=A0A6A5K9Y8_9PLEO|nr:hypothetical protein BDW02DRAFT_505000 [Decorospora gaudefroyi]
MSDSSTPQLAIRQVSTTPTRKRPGKCRTIHLLLRLLNIAAPDDLESPRYPRPTTLLERQLDRKLEEYDEWNTRLFNDLTLVGDDDPSFVRHNPKMERLPDEPMYHPAFEKAKTECQQIIRNITKRLQADEDTQLSASLRLRLDYAYRIFQSDQKYVGFLGQTGQGKSTLLGVLLGNTDLTVKSSCGESVTRLPLVYSQSRGSADTAKYEAELEMCNPRTCRDSIRTHVDNVLASLEKYDQGLHTDNQDQGDHSREILKGLFSDRPEFASDAALDEYLRSGSKEGNIYDELSQWVEERRRHVRDTTSRCFHAPTPTELMTTLAPFADLESFTPESKWPFNASSLVAKIHIFAELRLRLTFGDFPGLGDINKDRETKTRRQIEQCNVVVIVEDVNRACSSQFLDECLKEQYRRRPHQKVIVVLTKSEKDFDVNNRLNLAFDAAELEQLEYLKLRKEEISRQKQALHFRQYEKRQRLTYEAKWIELAEKEIFVRERSGRSEKKLKERYTTISNGGELSIFSVSAADYEKNLKGYSQMDDEPPLSAKATGIPDLMYELAKIPHEQVQDDMVQFFETTFPELLSSVELACTAPSMDVKPKIKYDFEDVVEAFKSQVDDSLRTLEEAEIIPFHSRVREFIPGWGQSAHILCAKWQDWHPASVRAFLAKRGSHRTRKVGTASWNEELLGIAQEDLDPAFWHLERRIRPWAVRLRATICGKVDAFIEQLRDEVSDLNSAAFVENVKKKRSSLINSFAFIEESIRKFLRQVNGQATNDGHGDFFSSAMTDIYQQAQKTTRKPYKDSAMQIFEDGVCATGGPFDAIPEGIEEAWRDHRTKVLDKAMAHFGLVIHEIQRGYNKLANKHEKKQPEVSQVRKDLVQMVRDARKKCDGEILGWLLEAGLDPNLGKRRKV